MALPLRQPYAPMDVMSVDEIPVGKNWQYEAKWDGFQCLVFRDGGTIELQSKSGQSLTRYFPELVAAVSALKARQFVRLVAQRLGPPGLAPVKPGGAISFSNFSVSAFLFSFLKPVVKPTVHRCVRLAKGAGPYAANTSIRLRFSARCRPVTPP